MGPSSSNCTGKGGGTFGLDGILTGRLPDLYPSIGTHGSSRAFVFKSPPLKTSKEFSASQISSVHKVRNQLNISQLVDF